MKSERRDYRRITRSGYFVAAILLHLVVFLMIADRVIFSSPTPNSDASQFMRVAIPPPAPPVPPTAGGEANNSAVEPATVVVPAPSATPAPIISMSASAFSVTVPKAPSTINSLPSLPSPAGTGLTTGSGGALGAGDGLFGSSSPSDSSGLEGYLYDLKQTPDRKPTGMTNDLYHQTVAQFVASGWDESKLSGFYKSPTPLHAKEIFIPVLSASEGPKNFGVEKDVQPNLYFVVYHCSVQSNTEGDFRFVGMGDDILVVRVNGVNVLDGCLMPVLDKTQKKYDIAWEGGNNNPAPYPYTQPFGSLRIGDSFHVDAYEKISIDVIIGEQPGGESAYFLLLKKDGETYENAANGFPKLPIFQIGSDKIERTGEYPPFSNSSVVWQNVP